MLWEFLMLSALALWLFYRWATANDEFFAKRNVPYDKPFPLLGSMKEMMLRKKSIFDVVHELYNKHSGKLFGVFDQRVPIFLIRDPELIKQITIKDFDHFVNHRPAFGDDNTLFGASLLFLQDAKWRDMRSTLSPVFTGSKMRQMFELISEVSQGSVAYLAKEVGTHGGDGYELDLKDVCTRFTNDVIASAAFGLEVNSFENPENEFYKMGKKVTNFTAWQTTKFFLYANFKTLMNLLKVDLFDKESSDYFMHLVLDAMKYRKDHNIFRPDMINLLMEARGMIKSENVKTHNREWNDYQIVGQCFVFFFAGFETSAVLMCFTAQELVQNPEIQQRLYEEIESVNRELNGQPLTYEALQSMKYLDMVVSEVLRKWPATVVTDRWCNKDYVIESDDGKRIEIKKGDSIWIPLPGIQRDPKYFENPDKFIPERFSDENKDKIVPGTYLPFGMGPRNCIGLRFALLIAKAMIFCMVRDFQFEAGKRTTIPMELACDSFQLKPKTGFWYKLKARTQA